MKPAPEPRFWGFFRQNWVPILGAMVFTCLAFGAMLTQFTLSIDEEGFIRHVGGSQNWLMEGRFGITLLNMLISPQGSYVPVLWDWLAVLIWSAAAPVFLYPFMSRDQKPCPWVIFVFCAYLGCVPLTTGEILSFSMFNCQVAIGLLCTATACKLSHDYLTQGRLFSLVGACLLLLFAISIYQAFAGVFLTWCLAWVLFETLALSPQAANRPVGNLLLRFTPVMVALALATAGYLGISSGISRFILGSNGYLARSYIGWSSDLGVFQALSRSVLNLVPALFGLSPDFKGLYGHWGIFITSCAFGLWMLVHLLGAGKKHWLPLLLFTGALMLAPIALYILLGTVYTPGRTLIALSLLGAVQWLVMTTFTRRKAFRVLALALAACVLLYNAAMMNRLFADSGKTYHYDRQAAQDIVQAVEAKGYNYEDHPLVLVGMLDTHPGETLRSSDSTGASFFSWDEGNIRRMINFMQAEGFRVVMPTPAQIAVAAEKALSLPTWPHADSVALIDDCIVVHLSAPTYNWYQVNCPGV